jgi:hypothetical protein
VSGQGLCPTSDASHCLAHASPRPYVYHPLDDHQGTGRDSRPSHDSPKVVRVREGESEVVSMTRGLESSDYLAEICDKLDRIIELLKLNPIE